MLRCDAMDAFLIYSESRPNRPNCLLRVRFCRRIRDGDFFVAEERERKAAHERYRMEFFCARLLQLLLMFCCCRKNLTHGLWNNIMNNVNGWMQHLFDREMMMLLPRRVVVVTWLD